MSSGKRYYWLKLKEDFFTSKRIKKLRGMAGGDTYLIIYLKLQLKAMKTDGIIRFDHLEDNIADELALDLDENPDDIRATLIYLTSCGLAEASERSDFFFPYAVENVGSESSAAERMRKMRERNNVTPLLRDRYGEKEIEKEIEIDTTTPTPPSDQDDEFQQIAREHSEILDAADNAGFQQNNATREKLIGLYADYGKDMVLKGISACVDQGKITIAYLKGCLRSLKAEAEKQPEEPYMDDNHEFWGWGQ